MPISDDIRAAAVLADQLYLAQQALHLAASTRRDLVWTVSNGRDRLARGESLESVAQLTRAQGAALRVSFSRGAALMDDIKAGMALMGFSGQGVQDSYDMVLAGCIALENTALDGSDLESLFSFFDQNFTAPKMLF